MQKQWNSMLGVSEASDEENDIVKVCIQTLGLFSESVW